jgi:hypothetical protein
MKYFPKISASKKVAAPQDDVILIIDDRKQPKFRGSPCEQIMIFAQVNKRENIEPLYRGIMGEGRQPDIFLASNIPEAQVLADDLAIGLRSHLEKNPSEVSLVIKRLATTTSLSPVVDTPAVRRAMAPPHGLATDFLSGLRIYSIPGENPAKDVLIQVDAWTLVFGANVHTATERISAAKRGKESGARGHYSWLDLGEPRRLHEPLASMVVPSFAVPNDVQGSDIVFPSEWHENGARPARGYRELQVLSMIPMAKKLMAKGAGIPILEAALARAEYRLTASRKGRGSVIHRDGFPHFWAGEERRLWLNRSVPLVKMH